MEQKKKKEEATSLQQSQEIAKEVTIWKRIKDSIAKFFAKHYKAILSVSAFFAVAFLFKKKLFNCMVPQSDIMTMINERAFKEVIVGSMFMVGYLKTPGMRSYVISNRSLLEDKQIIDSLQKQECTYSFPVINEQQIGYTVALGLYSYVLYKLYNVVMSQHSFKGKEQKAQEKVQQQVRSFEDIGGCNKAKDAIKEVIEYMKNPKLFMDAGVRMPKGLLLYGPPGTGKTLIAKAAAAEAKIPVIYTSGSEFVEIYVGVGAKRIREVFKQAREIGPCMIFIDEIDAIGYSRGNNNFIAGGGHRELETTLNQLLNEMDGFEENDRIIVVAATNLASTLDPALLRPGRFDRKIEIQLPNPKDRLDILKIHLKNKLHEVSDQHLQTAADKTDGLAGAELENIVNLAALNSVRKAHSLKQQRSSLTGQELLEFVQEFIEEKKKARGSNNYAQYYQQQLPQPNRQ